MTQVIEEVYLKNRTNNNPQAPRTLARLVTDSAKNRPLNESLTRLAEYQSLGFPAFSTSIDYAEGDPCFHDRRLYKAKAGGHSAGTWNAAHFEEFSVKEYTDAHVGIFDVSANNGGAVFASLQALLSDANLNTLIPAQFRRGGITITFIQGTAQSSDNKYIQFRYMSSSTAVADFTNVANWQGVDDVPTAESDNLVKSDGIFKETHIAEIIDDYYTDSDSYWKYDSGSIYRLYASGFKATKLIDVNIGDVFYTNTSILPPYITAVNVCVNANEERSLLKAITSEGIVTITEEMYNNGVRKIAFSFNLSSTPSPLVVKYRPINQTVSELDNKTIKTTPQSLSEQEKSQVKQNLGIVSDNVPTEDSTNLIESGGVYPLKETLDNTVSKMPNQFSTTIERTRGTSEDFIRGYITSGSPDISKNISYFSWIVDIEHDGYIFIDTNNYGNVGTMFRAGLTEDSETWKYYAADVSNMPTSNNKWEVHRGDKLYATVQGVDFNSSFIFQYEYSSYDYELKNTVTIPNQKIKIHYVNNTKFEVTIPQLGYNETEIVHTFIKQYNENNVSYGEGLSKNMVTADIWYPDQILINGNNAIQGNLNFIYRLTSENAHVGAGHGCEVSLFTKFLADGVEFNPNNTFDDIYCDVFRVILKSNMYATSSPSTGTNAIPVLDANGDPVITAVHTLNATYRVNNAIDWDNNLLIQRDNIKFLQLHAGMVQGQASAFEIFTICDNVYDTNKFTWNGSTFTKESLGGSVVLSQHESKKSSGVVMYGKGIIIKQTMERLGIPQTEADANDGQKANYCTCVYYEEANDPRLKIYMQPTRTDMVNGYLPKEEFNNGDVIRCRLEREIEVNL